ncbi:amino acid transporter [Metschnikowia bicuspidata var. bicuspidata NRRL YB-4993]|uniref:Amino acid transporter n=1 Tax=Metschnikowia bicuspidata var. bicuspidata NRRL YB-4993 TaxID=869754 RepID=A0A1A0HAX7_9ASCO|nr:amino acid transporter [Metschnikowia bicuspidata var. bicuspidata NRRL YB-4993]OBA21166.1 amino acid transporter [Metschnikowia bicuspidata var. bicuspidata NRRL YB-4993]
MNQKNLEIKPVVSCIKVDDLRVQSVLSNQQIVLNVDHQVDSDEAQILALGYKQELDRKFGAFSVFAVSFSVLGLLPSIAATFEYQQLVIGISPVPWILGMIGVTSVAYSMAEIASAFPTSAGTPYAVSQLAPKKWAPFLTWTTSFSNWMCQITAAPSVNYSGACFILSLASYRSGYVASTGVYYALTTAIMIMHAIISCMPTKYLAQFNNIGTLINMIFLIIVFVIIFACNDRLDMYDGAIPKFNSNSKAWGLTNQTDFPTGVAMLVSFLGVIWAMSGYDSPFHLAEECSNASVAAPRAICLTATVGGTIGFIFVLAISYTAVSLDLISEDQLELGQPFVTYLTQIMAPKFVVTCTSLTIISSWFMGSSCMLAASRVTYAYSRDGLFPFSNVWSKVYAPTKTPVNAVIMNLVLGQLLLLLMFGGETAIWAIFSVGGISSFISFTMPTLLKITYAQDTFQPGPWNLGRYSRPIGVFSVAFVVVMIPFLCFPTVSGKNLTPDSMNWTVLVFFGPMLIFTIWFLVDAHKWYTGPRPNIDEYISHGRSGAVLIEGLKSHLSPSLNDDIYEDSEKK